MRCAGEYFLARRLPVGVARLAGCCLVAGLQTSVFKWRTSHHAPGGAWSDNGGLRRETPILLRRAGLLSQRRLLLHIELEDSGIPPRDRRPSGARPVQAGLDRSLGRRNTFGT